MAMAAVHPRILGFLGRALSLELSAVQQSMTQASLVELWGETDAATRFRQDTVEELQHSERIVQRMLVLGVAPAASQLRPVQHAADLVGLLSLNQGLANDLIQLYGDAVRFCLLTGDAESADFFRALWNEEQQHALDLASWLQSLRSTGRDHRFGRAMF